jgi:hypothetical protein
MTTITEKDGHRILIKESDVEVNVNDGDVIQYEGIYYKTVNNSIEPVKTTFVGVVKCGRSTYYTGVEGIYVKPLYVLDTLADEWYKIVGLEPPKTKYFYYPHLLMLSQHNMYPSCYYPIYSLDTCENKSLDEFRQLNARLIVFTSV